MYLFYEKNEVNGLLASLMSAAILCRNRPNELMACGLLTVVAAMVFIVCSGVVNWPVPGSK